MNQFEIIYNGSLRTEAKHVDSNSTIITDAPKDNKGKGEYFSPTDLVCTALASCILTIMGIAAQKYQLSIKGTTAKVIKHMSQNPRMIAKIEVDIYFPSNYNSKIKKILERSAHNCPVHKSISKKTLKIIKFHYQM
tara:strand:- start:132 stop:539 length:408 start_codon:yes stop_codon:yes gene_type:complete